MFWNVGNVSERLSQLVGVKIGSVKAEAIYSELRSEIILAFNSELRSEMFLNMLWNVGR